MNRVVALCFALAVFSTCLSCKKPGVASSAPLETSFSNAPAEVKESVQRVDSSLKSGDYPSALNHLAKAATNHRLDQAQRDAIGATLARLNDEAATNAALNTPENTILRQHIMAQLNQKR